MKGDIYWLAATHRGAFSNHYRSTMCLDQSTHRGVLGSGSQYAAKVWFVGQFLEYKLTVVPVTAYEPDQE